MLHMNLIIGARVRTTQEQASHALATCEASGFSCYRNGVSGPGVQRSINPWRHSEPNPTSAARWSKSRTTPHHQRKGDQNKESEFKTMSTQLLNQIKDGVAGIMEKQGELDSRLSALEASGLKGRQRKALSGGVYTDRKEISPERVALANLFAKDGVSDPFKKAGLSEWAEKVVREATTKALDTGSGGGGGAYVIPQHYLASSFIEMLRANSVVLRAGATLLDGLTGSPVIVPKQLTASTVYWIGENSTLTASDPSFGQVQLTPKTMAILAQFSNLLNILSSPKIEEGVGSLLTLALGTNGGDLTIDSLYDLMGKLEDANTVGKTMALITSPKGVRKLKKQRIANYSGQTDGSYAIPSPLLTDESLSKAIGLNVFTTTQIPVNLTKGSSTDCTEVFFGDWSNLLIDMWGSLEVLATNVGGTAWTQNAVQVRLIQNVDVAVRHGQSFVLCNDARTA
jgi:hypothetical protein